jgi:hypothetical protein
MARRRILARLVLTALVFGASRLGAGQDGDAVTTGSTEITFDETVRVALQADYVTHRTTIWDLFHPYFPATGSDPFSTFQVDIYAITDYEVMLTKLTSVSLVPGGTTTASVDVVDDLLEIRTVSLVGDDDDLGQVDNPTLDWVETLDWTPFPDGDRLFFSGGNTEGGSATSHTAFEALRVNLEALRNNASGNAFTFTLTVTVTEQ